MTTRGVVLEVSDDTAKVRIHRSTACEACHNRDASGQCHAELMLSETPRTLDVAANNAVNAGVGDLVEVVTDEKRGLLLSFVCFVLPLLAAALGYALCFYLLGQRAAAIGCTVLFAVSFGVCIAFSDRYSKNHVRIEVLRIVAKSGENGMPQA